MKAKKILKDIFNDLGIVYKKEPINLIVDYNNEIIGYIDLRLTFNVLNDAEIKKIEKYLKDNKIEIQGR